MNEFRRASNEFKAQIEQEIAHLEVEKRPTILPPNPVEGTTSRTWNTVEAEPAASNPPATLTAPVDIPTPDAPDGAQAQPAGATEAAHPAELLHPQAPRNRMPELVTPPVRAGESEKESMPTMGFLDHLEELRKRIVYSIAFVAVGFFVCWWKVRRSTTTCSAPSWTRRERSGLAEKLVYLNPTEPFNLYLKIAALAGLFLTSPFVLYQVWMFISPELSRKKNTLCLSWSRPSRFFTCGGYFGYKDRLSRRPQFPHQFRKAVPADDHHR